jgi:hypothetical protein
MDVSLIQVPFMAGDGTHPASQGPSRLVEAGAERLLDRFGSAVEHVQVELPPEATRPDVVTASAAVNQRYTPANDHDPGGRPENHRTANGWHQVMASSTAWSFAAATVWTVSRSNSGSGISAS